MYAIYCKYFDSQHHQYFMPAKFYSLVKKLKSQVAPTPRSIMKSFPKNIIVRNWNYLDFNYLLFVFPLDIILYHVSGLWGIFLPKRLSEHGKTSDLCMDFIYLERT